MIQLTFLLLFTCMLFIFYGLNQYCFHLPLPFTGLEIKHSILLVQKLNSQPDFTKFKTHFFFLKILKTNVDDFSPISPLPCCYPIVFQFPWLFRVPSFVFKIDLSRCLLTSYQHSALHSIPISQVHFLNTSGHHRTGLSTKV